LTAGVADQSGEVADDEYRRVAEVLELTELAQNHGVAEVQVRSRRIDPQLHSQGPAELELFPEIPLRDDGGGAGEESFEVRGHDGAMLSARVRCTRELHRAA
jgi:hypothetical protein